MTIQQSRVRLLELRKKVNDLLDAELSKLDEEELREAKEANGKPRTLEGAISCQSVPPSKT